jgi:hypothetical protein
MADTVITRAVFERRIADLCLGGVGPGLPRRQRDRHVLLKAVVLSIGQGRKLSEKVLNDSLRSWLNAVGAHVSMDHVSLRRYLIDGGYIARDRAGREYTVLPSDMTPGVFEPAVDVVDPIEVVRAASRTRAERRAELGKLEDR